MGHFIANGLDVPEDVFALKVWAAETAVIGAADRCWDRWNLIPLLAFKRFVEIAWISKVFSSIDDEWWFLQVWGDLSSCNIIEQSFP